LRPVRGRAKIPECQPSPTEAATMTSDDISKSQAAVIQKALFPGVNYLVRLRTRME